MAQPAPKRMRLSTQDVLHELEKDEEPITAGSDDELICEEKERDEWGATDTGGMLDTHLSHGSPLRSGGDQISSTSPSLSLSPMTTSTPPHTPTGPSSSRMTNPPTGGDQTSSTSPSLSLSPMAMPIPPHSPTGPSTSHLSRMALPIPPHSPTVSDPLSLPLSAYLSQPLTNLVKALKQEFVPVSTPSVQAAATPPRPVNQGGSHQSRPRPSRPSRPSRPFRPTSSVSAGSWSSTLTDVDIAPFVQDVGPTVSIPQVRTDVFQLFFTDNLCQYIVEQTNLYAQQVLGPGYDNWEKLDREELRAYFGFQILMGLVSQPKTEDYWRRDEFHFGPIADRISRKRFSDIHRFLHFSDNTAQAQRGQPGYDRLGKVRSILERVQDKLINLYNPHCENAVDEAMIPFQGRSTLKQYMPAKPVKRGIKVWCRADSYNGYMCEVQVYAGRAAETEGGLGMRVVLDLAQHLEGKKYHIYVDNFFTSVTLLQTLLERGLYACGTARQNSRGFPSALKLSGKGKRELERHGLSQR